MTIYLSMGTGEVSVTRTLEGEPEALQAQITALVARLIAMQQAVAEVPA